MSSRYCTPYHDLAGGGLARYPALGVPLELGADAGDDVLVVVVILSELGRCLVTSRAPAAEMQQQPIRQDDDEAEEENDERRRQEVRPVALLQTAVRIVTISVSTAGGRDVIDE